MFHSEDSFSANYTEARRKFREAAADAGGELDSWLHPEAGPDGGEIFTDVAWIGPSAATKVLVLISATHGVEGFCGSGAQVDLMRRGEVTGDADDLAFLLIHAINPYGFAWLRRTTHENIDLNRNWVDYAQPMPVNEGYRALHPALCPAVWTDETRAAGELALQTSEREIGRDATRNAYGAGQWEYPDGLFYGGTAPSWSRQTQTAIFDRWLGKARKVAIVDYHTGLGPLGFAEPIVTAPVGSPAYRRARSWYGATTRSTAGGLSVGARIEGDGLTGAIKLLPHAEVTPMALEYGTLPRREVINANREDNWLHSHGDPRGDGAQATKGRLRDAYFVDRTDWKGMVIGQSLQVFRQAVSGLSED
ncbi:DUF2817 domain-containing protein [Sphingobium amiense]|uniref:DUF2817 domain-containing protein n=2 Tax=Sphingobium amiense TaxID=135719 RepID=A0A494W9C0_9SPHN|nr:M14 family metallopeptidase [Sphingobium amiense]BBD96789.1 DUF2817 domain-containing protein [Sphingobium amiense]